jgi:hypothetical protein
VTVLDQHRVRLDLRPQYALERSLAKYLTGIGIRPAARTLRVHELLELGLTAPAANNPIEAHSGETVKVGCQLTRPGDSPVLDALTPIPPSMRAAYLRQWLLAGFCASRGTASSAPAAANQPPPGNPTPPTNSWAPLTASSAQKGSTTKEGAKVPAPAASHTNGPIVLDVDLSQPGGALASAELADPRPSASSDLQPRSLNGAKVRTADGEIVDAPPEPAPIRADLRGLLG